MQKPKATGGAQLRRLDEADRKLRELRAECQGDAKDVGAFLASFIERQQGWLHWWRTQNAEMAAAVAELHQRALELAFIAQLAWNQGDHAEALVAAVRAAEAEGEAETTRLEQWTLSRAKQAQQVKAWEQQRAAEDRQRRRGGRKEITDAELGRIADRLSGLRHGAVGAAAAEEAEGLGIHPGRLRHELAAFKRRRRAAGTAR